MTLEEYNEQQAAIYQDEYEQLLQENARLKERQLSLLNCLCDIQQQCLMEITMGYRLEAVSIGMEIRDATGLNAAGLLELVRAENEKV